MTIQPDQADTSIADLVVNAIEDPGTRRKHIGIAAKIVGHDHAEDVVQEAYIKAFKARSRFVNNRLNSWLTRIVINTSLTYKKKQKKYCRNSSNDEHKMVDATQETDLQDKEFWQHMDDLVRQFDPPKQRHIKMVLLNNCLGIEYKQIAEIFKVPIGTVMSSIHRGRYTLRHELEYEGNDYSPKQ